jgi:hypothetical protein
MSEIALVAAAVLVAGILARIAVLSAMQMPAQMTLPSRVGARRLATDFVVFLLSMVPGRVARGHLTSHIEVPPRALIDSVTRAGQAVWFPGDARIARAPRAPPPAGDHVAL